MSSARTSAMLAMDSRRGCGQFCGGNCGSTEDDNTSQDRSDKWGKGENILCLCSDSSLGRVPSACFPGFLTAVLNLRVPLLSRSVQIHLHATKERTDYLESQVTNVALSSELPLLKLSGSSRFLSSALSRAQCNKNNKDRTYSVYLAVSGIILALVERLSETPIPSRL